MFFIFMDVLSETCYWKPLCLYKEDRFSWQRLCPCASCVIGRKFYVKQHVEFREDQVSTNMSLLTRWQKLSNVVKQKHSLTYLLPTWTSAETRILFWMIWSLCESQDDIFLWVLSNISIVLHPQTLENICWITSPVIQTHFLVVYI